jgi:octaprenyl-diphosphate synthase
LNRVTERLRGLGGEQTPYVSELLGHVLDTTGKRMRPALALMASRFHPNDGQTADMLAVAVELLHVASLIHDDVVDNSDTRHGRATVWSRWGQDTAVLLGDYLLATSTTFICATGNLRVIRRFSETALDLSVGELYEMDSKFDGGQTREDYLRRIYNKTGSMFAIAGEAGAVVSGAPEPVVQALKSYGYNLGMAFQIVDDILDLDGTSEEVGKPVGNDLAQGILTLPAIIAIERDPGENPVAELFRTPDDEDSLRRAVEAVQDASVIDEAYTVADEFRREALHSLAALERNPFRDSLEELVSYVVRRRS